MPLLKGKSNIGKNIEELVQANENKPDSKKRVMAQIRAIAIAASKR